MAHLKDHVILFLGGKTIFYKVITAGTTAENNPLIVILNSELNYMK